MAPVKAFISFSSKDETYKDDFKMHLNPLVRQDKIKLWDSKKLHAGLDWDKKIKAQIEAAHIIFFLVSPDSLFSDYINDVEISRALERCKEGTAILVPVILRPCDWKEHMNIAKHHLAVPMYAKPISTWQDRDAAYVDAVRQIRGLLSSEELERIVKGQTPETGITSNTTLTKSDNMVTNLMLSSLKSNTQQEQKAAFKSYQRKLQIQISRNKFKEVLESLQTCIEDNLSIILFSGEWYDLEDELRHKIIHKSDSRYTDFRSRLLHYVSQLEADEVNLG